MAQSKNHIYRGTGGHFDHVVATLDPIAEPVRAPTIADLVPVIDIMTRDVTSAARDLRVSPLVSLMVSNHIGCVPVVDDRGRPVGVITKLDLVEQLLAAGTEAAPQTADDVMMPIALTLGTHATVAHAAALMASEDVHHVPIVDEEGVLVGVISSMDIVRWLAANDGFAKNAS